MTITNGNTNLDEWVVIKVAEFGELFAGASLSLSYSVQVYNADKTKFGTAVTRTVDGTDKDTHYGVVKLTGGQYSVVSYTYNFPSVAGNTYQGKTGTANITVDAVQARNNTKTMNYGPTACN